MSYPSVVDMDLQTLFICQKIINGTDILDDDLALIICSWFPLLLTALKSQSKIEFNRESKSRGCFQ